MIWFKMVDSRDLRCSSREKKGGMTSLWGSFDKVRVFECRFYRVAAPETRFESSH